MSRNIEDIALVWRVILIVVIIVILVNATWDRFPNSWTNRDRIVELENRVWRLEHE